VEPINWHSFFFLFFALVACGFAVAVTLASNVVKMAFYLVVSLGAVAGLFFLAGADFVGTMQLVIYVGGTMVLLVFGVMLTATDPAVDMKTRAGQWILAALIGGSLLAVLLQAAFSVDDWHHPPVARTAESPHTATKLGLGLLGVRVDRLDETDPTRRSGMSGYLLVFELISVHLLVVLIGAAYMARTKRWMASNAKTQVELKTEN